MKSLASTMSSPLRIVPLLFFLTILIAPITITDTATTNYLLESTLENPSNLTPLVNVSHVVANHGDPYVNAFILSRSESYNFGENAIGAPDGQFSIIYVDYSNGYLTL